jgi:hypothetical protein
MKTVKSSVPRSLCQRGDKRGKRGHAGTRGRTRVGTRAPRKHAYRRTGQCFPPRTEPRCSPGAKGQWKSCAGRSYFPYPSLRLDSQNASCFAGHPPEVDPGQSIVSRHERVSGRRGLEETLLARDWVHHPNPLKMQDLVRPSRLETQIPKAALLEVAPILCINLQLALDFPVNRTSMDVSPPIQFRIEWADSQGMSPLLGCRPI